MDRDIFSFAGLYVGRKDSEGHSTKSFTILTTTPNELVVKMHDRMPVILAHDEEKLWLDHELVAPERIRVVLDPYPAELMRSYMVDWRVGSFANNHDQLILQL